MDNPAQKLATMNSMAFGPAQHSPEFATLLMIRQAGGVRRYHTEPMLPPQRVDSHSWQGAQICLVLWPDRVNVAMAMLNHDTGELASGDLPAPAKWYNPKLKVEAEHVEVMARVAMGTHYELDADDELRLKFADSVELMWYCGDQYRSGNQFAKEIYWKVHRRWANDMTTRRVQAVLGSSALVLFEALTKYVEN